MSLWTYWAIATFNLYYKKLGISAATNSWFTNFIFTTNPFVGIIRGLRNEGAHKSNTYFFVTHGIIELQMEKAA